MAVEKTVVIHAISAGRTADFQRYLKRLGNVFLYGSDAKTKVITKAKNSLQKK